MDSASGRGSMWVKASVWVASWSQMMRPLMRNEMPPCLYWFLLSSCVVWSQMAQLGWLGRDGRLWYISWLRSMSSGICSSEKVFRTLIDSQVLYYLLTKEVGPRCCSPSFPRPSRCRDVYSNHTRKEETRIGKPG